MIYPYVKNELGWTLSDKQMAGMWDLIVAQGYHEVVFYSDRVKNATDFINFCREPGNVVHFDFEIKDDDLDPLLVAWCNNFGPNYAFGHFCFLGDCDKPMVARRTLDYWFAWKPDGKTPLLDVVLGKIPAFNQRAIRFIEKLGFYNMGTVPLIGFGKPPTRKCGAAFLYITREEFLNG